MDETKMTAMPVNAQTLTELTRILQKYEPDKAGALMESITGRAAPGGKTAKRAAKLKGKESGRMERARSSAYNAALPGGGR